MGSKTSEKRPYTAENGKSTDPSSEPDMKKVKIEQPTVTGREIVTKYLRGDMAAVMSYQKICAALQTISDWPSEESKAQVIEQFLSMADLLDTRCDALVKNLLKIRWDAVPTVLMPDFKKFLADLGVRQISYTENVYTVLVSYLAPEMVSTEKEVDGKVTTVQSFKHSVEVQQEFYQMAHGIISHIIKCFPMSSKLLLKVVQQGYPHYLQNPSKVEGYIKNVLLLQQYAPLIREACWKSLFNRLVQDDAQVSKGRDDQIFALVDNELPSSSSSESTSTSHDELLQKQLDASCVDVMTYFTKMMNPEEKVEGDEWIQNASTVVPDDMFTMCIELFESEMLVASHVRCVSYVFLHLCSLKKEFATKMLDSLWRWIIRMPLAPVDTKKSHGACAYLAAFLTKANYIDFNTTFIFLEKIIGWLTRYADQFGSGTKNVQSGTIRHSLFYALCQTFFTVFSYRYKEFVKKHDKLTAVRHWGIGKVVNSPLEPLKFVVRRVALCFSAITRSLQLVYCSHLIPIEDICEMPFEQMFPFDGPFLEKSAAWLSPLTRHFTPLPEDVGHLASILRFKVEETEEKNVNENVIANHEMDFLDVEDAFFQDLGTLRSRTSSFITTSYY